MKQFKFSLSTILVGTAIAAAAISCISRWASPQRGSSFIEHVLLLAWSLTFAVAFARSRAIGWKRFCASGLIASEVWSLGILATYATFLIPIKSHGFKTTDIAIRALALILFGCALTLGLAMGAWLAGRAMRWLGASIKRWLAAAVLALVICAALLLVVRNRPSGPSVWMPTLAHGVKSFAKPSYAPNGVPVRLLPPGFPCTSSDGRLVAIRNGPRLSVLDETSLDSVAEFQADPGSWFSDAAFLSDGSYLAALQISEDGCATLMRWEATNWHSQSPVQVSELVDDHDCSKVTPVLAGDLMVMAQEGKAAPGGSRLNFATVDLRNEKLTLAPFATVILAFDEKTGGRHYRSSPWYASQSGDYIVSGAGEFESRDAAGTLTVARNRRHLLRRGVRHATLLPSDSFGFLPGGGLLVGREWTSQRVWKRSEPETDAPPFWDYLKREGRYRVFVFSCASGRRLAQSPWLPCSPPELDSSSMRITADYRNDPVSWDLRTFGDVVEDANRKAHSD